MDGKQRHSHYLKGEYEFTSVISDAVFYRKFFNERQVISASLHQRQCVSISASASASTSGQAFSFSLSVTCRSNRSYSVSQILRYLYGKSIVQSIKRESATRHLRVRNFAPFFRLSIFYGSATRPLRVRNCSQHQFR